MRRSPRKALQRRSIFTYNSSLNFLYRYLTFYIGNVIHPLLTISLLLNFRLYGYSIRNKGIGMAFMEEQTLNENLHQFLP